MDFHQLKVFLRVAQHKSFSKAAEDLYLTQPTISSHIMGLENELGTRLFDRGGKDVELTPAGVILYKRAIKIIEDKENTLLEIKQYLGSIEGELYLCASSIPATYILPNLIKQFNMHYPKVKFKVKQTDSGMVNKLVLEGELEIGISGAMSKDGNLEFIPFCKDELVLIAPKGFKAKNSIDDQKLDLKSVMQEKFIVREKKSGTRLIFENALKKKGIKLNDFNIIAEFGSSAAIIKAVKEGLGLSVTSERAVRDLQKKNLVEIYRINGLEIFRDFYIVCKKARTLSPNAKTFKEFILKL